MVSKEQMIKLLGQNLKLFTDKIEHSGSIEVASAVSMDDFNAAIEKLKNEK